MTIAEYKSKRDSICFQCKKSRTQQWNTERKCSFFNSLFSPGSPGLYSEIPQ